MEKQQTSGYFLVAFNEYIGKETLGADREEVQLNESYYNGECRLTADYNTQNLRRLLDWRVTIYEISQE